MPRTKTVLKYHGRQRALIRDLFTDLTQLQNDSNRGINTIIETSNQAGALTTLIGRTQAALGETITITIVTS